MEIVNNIKLVMELIDNKKCRESFCRNYLSENPILSPMIIEYWDLNRITKKYLTKERLYDENSYSKKKIKEEETIFLRKSFLFQPLRFYFERQWLLTQELYSEQSKFANAERDYRFYLQTTIFANERFEINDNIQLYIKKNNKIRFDLMDEILENAVVREKIVYEYIKECSQLVFYIIHNFNLKFCIDKYDRNISFVNESSYKKRKLKEEESFLIKKIIEYVIWLKKIRKFERTQRLILDDFMIESEPKSYNENIRFLQKLTVVILESFFKGELDIDADVSI